MDPNDVSRREPAGLHLRLLGRFELYQGTCPLHVSPSGERLLAYLGIRSEPVGRGSAAAELWPGCTDARAAANLRSAVWRLPGHDQGGLIAASPQHLALDARVSVDLHDLTRQVDPGGAARRSGTDVGVDVLRQDVLPEWPEEWLIGTREWFRQIRLHALEALCDRYRDDGRLDAALNAGITAVAADPLRESAHRRLTLVHIEEGNFAEALRQYDVFRRLMRTELGLPPSPHFRRLVAPLLGRPLDGSHGAEPLSQSA
ncbi:MAG: transcriptional regulator [Actinomycetota bacterium]|nr:transcriptional regulator [Actinomycetota bacterium]